jgi:hypothetical protein
MVRKTIGVNPLDAVIPPRPLEPAVQVQEESPAEKKVRLTIHLRKDVQERLRAAAYWTPGETLAGIVERAVDAEVDRMEKERGEAFPASGKLRTGRPPLF